MCRGGGEGGNRRVVYKTHLKKEFTNVLISTSEGGQPEPDLGPNKRMTSKHVPLRASSHRRVCHPTHP